MQSELPSPQPNVCLFSCLHPVIDVKRLFLRFRIINPLYYHWTTHGPRALSDKDPYVAQISDDMARRLGRTAASSQIWGKRLVMRSYHADKWPETSWRRR